MNISTEKTFHIHLVSDATGETISSVARACLVQFGSIQKEEHHWTLIRTKRQLDLVFEGLRQWPGLVLYTFINDDMAKAMHDQCQRMGAPSLSILGPAISVLSGFFGVPSAHDPGKQHELDKEYFKRIEAMDFAMSLDDGNKTDNLGDADVVILGVSRTSKTPTCIYLSHRGIKAANVPIIPGIQLDVDFKRLTKPMIIGLTSRPDELVETRRSRLRFLNQGDTDYINPEKVREEILEARRLFAKIGCPVIDVTRKSVEETSAEILMLLKKREIEQVIKDSEHD